MGNLEVRLFGQVSVSQSNTLSQLQLTNSCQKLLAYLLLNTGRMCRREALIDVFWRDSSPERARSCLNSALWRLRRELEPGGTKTTHYLMTSESGEIGFNWASDYWLDVQIFEQRVAPTLKKPVAEIEPGEATQLERMLSLYRGDLLEGIYEDWTLIERERFRIMYLNSLAQLMNYHIVCGAFEKAMEFARAILKVDPLREDIHRALMRLHVSAGQRALALQQYRTCVMVLHRELDVAPMEETQQLYRQIYDLAALPPLLDAELAPVHLDAERHLRSVVRNLEQAHTHLKQAAHVMTHLIHIKVDG